MSFSFLENAQKGNNATKPLKVPVELGCKIRSSINCVDSRGETPDFYFQDVLYYGASNLLRVSVEELCLSNIASASLVFLLVKRQLMEVLSYSLFSFIYCH